MDLVEPIPERLLPHIRDELQPGELLIVLLSADIRSDGQYGDSWFALTDERILVFHPNGADKPETVRLGLDEVQGIQTRNFVGSGALVVELEDETVELLRFSQSAYYKFSGVPQAIEGAGLVEEEDAEGDGPLHVDPVKVVEHCPTCGRAHRSGSKVCPNCLRQTETFWRLFSYIKPYKTQALLGFTLTILLTAIGLLPPQLNRILIDDVIVPELVKYEAAGIAAGEATTPPAASVQYLLWVVLGLLGIYIGRGIISGVRMYALGWLGQRVVYDLQMQIFQHLQLLSLTFYNKLSTGRIMTRVTSDTERMRSFITSGFQDIVIDGLTIIGICTMLFVMNWELALLSLLPIPFMIIGTIIYRTRIHWIFHRIWRRISTLNAMLADSIPGVKVVKAFAQENRELDRFNERNTDLREIADDRLQDALLLHSDDRLCHLSRLHYPVVVWRQPSARQRADLGRLAGFYLVHGSCSTPPCARCATSPSSWRPRRLRPSASLRLSTPSPKSKTTRTPWTPARLPARSSSATSASRTTARLGSSIASIFGPSPAR